MRPYAFLILNWCFWEQKPLAPGLQRSLAILLVSSGRGHSTNFLGHSLNLTSTWGGAYDKPLRDMFLLRQCSESENGRTNIGCFVLV